MKKIITSVGMIVFVAALIAGGTGAFFSDTEESLGNIFTAGAVTLGITGISHEGNTPDEVVGFSVNEEGNNLSFEFTDLKPLDAGTVTYDLENGANQAHICVLIEETGNDDNGINDPETDAGDVTPGAGGGELGQFLSFMLGSATGTLAEISGEWQSLGTVEAGSSTNSAIDYCFGEFDGENCVLDEGAVYNLAQTDTLTADIEFYAVQTRHNEEFDCSSLNEEVEPGLLVGADLTDFVASICTVTVADGESIQGAIDANPAGSTICVAPGTHDTDTYPIRVNKDNTTLTSTDGAATTILNGGVILDNDGTEVSGFTLTSSTLLGETFGVYINTGADGVNVSFNDMNGPGVGSGRGVVNAIGVTNAIIANNEISNYLTGVFMNPSSGMLIEDNDLVANGVGSGNDNPTGNTIRGNHITANTIEGVGVLSVGTESIEVNFNNIFGNGGAGNELNSYDPIDPVDAEDNWWGDLTPADEIGGAGAAFVDFTPFAGAVYAQN